MSVINKKPFIKSLLESCSDEELQTLSTLIDGGGNQTPIRRSANPIANADVPHISSTDKGIKLCNLTINYTNWLGYLIYNDDYCVLISFTDAQVLKVFDLTDDVTRPNTVDEAINILELRSALYEVKGGSGGGDSSNNVKRYDGNVTELSGEFIEQLKVGDVIEMPDGNRNYTYVSYIEESGSLVVLEALFLDHPDGPCGVDYVYVKNDDTWEYDGEYAVPLGGGSGSSSLYLHSIFISYNDGQGKSFDLYLNLTNTSSTAFTKSSLKSYFQTFSSVWCLDASGYAYSDRAEGPIQRITNAATSGLITVDGFKYDNGSLSIASFMTLIDITDASIFQDNVSNL